MADKDEWNMLPPRADRRFAKYVNHPGLGRLLPALYPGVFAHLAACSRPRADLHAILLAGIPEGVVPGSQNYTGAVEADMIRLNVAVPPAASRTSSGWSPAIPPASPTGAAGPRRHHHRGAARHRGVTIPLVDSPYRPDAAADGLTDGTTDQNPPCLDTFPYLGFANGGYHTRPGTTAVSGGL